MIPILDNGHGGVINGQYQTPGKRSPFWHRGVLYEGAFNRWIVNGIMKKLDLENKPYFHVSPELEDITLGERVRRTNTFNSQVGGQGYLVSIHANAGGGTGWEIFTSPGETKSDDIADEFILDLHNNIPLRFRTDETDGDQDKEANFYLLRNTNCPAVLLELGFMDHSNDYELLWSEDYHNKVIDRLVTTIKRLY